MKRPIIAAAFVVLASLGPVLAQENTTPPAVPPAVVRASGATTKPTTQPVISQAEAYALRKENADLEQQIKDLRIKLAAATKLAHTPTTKPIARINHVPMGPSKQQLIDQMYRNAGM